jgi:3-oxoacyl-[acyl-carrier protein] reductase
VNTVSPGDTYFPGGFWDNVSKQMPEIYERTVSLNPMGRLCTPEEIAEVVTFISSPVASFVSGVNWLVDGAATDHIQV